MTRDDLRTDPRGLSPPHSLLGTFERSGGFNANPATWRLLPLKAIAVRGDELNGDDVWFDAGGLREWNRANLDTYWSSKVEEWRRIEPNEIVVRHEYGFQWLVLGVPRLHFTIATLEVTSKTGAGRYALGVVDARWREVIETAIALRSDRDSPLPSSPQELMRDAADVTEWLIQDAHRHVEA